MDYRNTPASSLIREEMPPEPREEMPPQPSREEMPPMPLKWGLQEEMPPMPSGYGPSDFEAGPSTPWSARIGRILAAVGPKIVPPDLNRDHLERALRTAISDYRELVEFRSGHLWKDKVPELKDFDRLSSLVQSVRWPVHPPSGELRRVQDWCRSMLAEIEHGWRPERWHPDLKGKSSINLLVGYFLRPIFEAYFRRRIGCTPTGPYARFVMAVLEESKIRKSDGNAYAAETIKSAVRLKTPRSSRQGVSLATDDLSLLIGRTTEPARQQAIAQAI